MKATVFGAGGFIGSRLVGHLRRQGFDCDAVLRGDESWQQRDLGHVFYCIGLTADFRSRPFDTIDAHVTYLTRVLLRQNFASLLYLSSTRVYAGASSTREETPLIVNPSNAGDLYDLSKLLGEAACLAVPSDTVRIARLSNVYGAGMGDTNFLGSIIRDALVERCITLGTAPQSEKDYVSTERALSAFTRIALEGRNRLYNVATGTNTRHSELLDRIVEITGCEVRVAENAPLVNFPPIDVGRIDELLGANSANVVTHLLELVESARGVLLSSK